MACIADAPAEVPPTAAPEPAAPAAPASPTRVPQRPQKRAPGGATDAPQAEQKRGRSDTSKSFLTPPGKQPDDAGQTVDQDGRAMMQCAPQPWQQRDPGADVPMCA
jgi:hypothetical protein